MSTAIATTEVNGKLAPDTLESVLLGGDLSKLNAQQRVSYLVKVCESIGLNPLTKPFEFIVLNGKLQMYAKKDCTEQLRKLNGVSIKIIARELVEGCYIVTAQATDKTGRADESIGAVPIDKLTGEARANAMMKAETKAKRRVTLSISGLGMLDEVELDSIPGARAPEPVGDNLEERLQSSLAAANAGKKANAQMNIPIAAEILEGEIVEQTRVLDEARSIDVPTWPFNKGTEKNGLPITDPRVSTKDLNYWAGKLSEQSNDPKWGESSRRKLPLVEAEIRRRNGVTAK